MKKAAVSKSKKGSVAQPPRPQKASAVSQLEREGSAGSSAGSSTLPPIPAQRKKSVEKPSAAKAEVGEMNRPPSASSLPSDKEALPPIKSDLSKKKKKKGKKETSTVADIPKPPPLPSVPDSAMQSSKSLGRAHAPPPGMEVAQQEAAPAPQPGRVSSPPPPPPLPGQPGKIVRFEIQSWGYEDPQRKGFIKIQGRMAADLSDRADNKDFARGLHIVTTRDDPTEWDSKIFDIWGDESEAERCTAFLLALAPGTLVAGASADEISKNIKLCRPALESLGVNAKEIGYRSSLAFLARVGDPSFTIQKSAPRNKGPTLLSHPVIIGEDAAPRDILRPTPNQLKNAKQKLKSRQDNKQKVFYGRDKLFDDFKVASYYPLEKVKDLFTLPMDNAVLSRLDFSGVDQLTDFVFAIFRNLHKGSLVCRGITGICLQGCSHVTDLGVRWMVDTFQQLTSINLSGCRQVTEKSLHYLLSKKEELESLLLRGTDVGVIHVPQGFSTASIKMHGSPLVSPPPRFLWESVILTNGTFFKETETTTKVISDYKAIVMATEHVESSLTDFLSASGSVKRTLLNINPELQVGGDATFCMIECEEAMADMFLSDRTLYVLPYSIEKDVGINLSSLMSRLSQVLTKVPTAVFLVVGIMESGRKIKTTSRELQKQFSQELKKMQQTLRSSANDVKDRVLRLQEPVKFKAQQESSRLYGLMDSLESLMGQIVFVQEHVDVTTPSDADRLKAEMASCCSRLQDFHPFYHRLSVEFTEVAATASSLSHSKASDGDVHVFREEEFLQALRDKHVESMGTLLAPYRKCLQLLHKMGKLLYIQNDYKGYVITDLDWFSKVINQMTLQSEVTEKSSFSWLDSQTRILDKKKLVKVQLLQKTEIPAFLEVLRLNRLILESGDQIVLTPWLLKQPPVSEEHFLPKDDSKTFKRLEYRYTFSHKVSRSFIAHLVAVVTELGTPAAAWQQGIIIQDSPLTVRLKQDTEESIVLQVQCIALVSAQSEKYMWTTADLYQTLIDAALTHHFHSYYNTHLFCDGMSQPSSDLLNNHSGIMYKHKLEAKVKASDGDLEQTTCSHCGRTANQIQLLWKSLNLCEPTLSLESCAMSMNTELQKKGTWFTTKPGQTEVTVPLLLTPAGFSHFDVTLLSGKSIQIGVQEKQESTDAAGQKSTDAAGVIYDGTEHVIQQRSYNSDWEMAEEEKVPLKEVYSLERGDTLRLECAAQPDAEKCTFNFYKNGEKFFSLSDQPCNLYQPRIYTKEQVTFLLDTSLSPKYGAWGQSWEAGMKLEALDRMTPGYVCVATIFHVQDDQVHVHFDGWTDRYSYRTTTDSEDLHPIGFMEQRKNLHPKWVQKLQPPKNYRGPFDYNQYLKSVKAFPVPHHLFSEKQTEGAAELILEEQTLADILQSSQGSKSFSNFNCMANKSQPGALRQTLAQKAKSYTPQSSNPLPMFCLLPAKLDDTLLNYPSLAAVSDFSTLMLHFVCENPQGWLHLVDLSGQSVTLDHSDIAGMTDQLLEPLFGMMSKVSFLPRNIKNLVKNADKMDPAKIETGMRQLLDYMICMLHLIKQEKLQAENGEQELSEPSPRYFKKVEDYALLRKQLSPGAATVGGDHTLICASHLLSIASKTADEEPRSFQMEDFSQYSHMISHLDLSNRKIPELPSEFFLHFPHLKDLRLSEVGLSVIPEGLARIENLVALDISSNNISALPKDFSSCSKKLQSLVLSNNPLYEIPPSVYQCSHLTVLEMDNVGLTSLADDIGNLQQLEILSLADHSLSTLPDTMSKLTKLESLDASGVMWIEGQDNQRTILSKDAFDAYCDRNFHLARLGKKEREELFASCDENQQGILDFKGVQKLNAAIFIMFSRFSKPEKEEEGQDQYGGCPKVIFSLPKLLQLNLSFQGLERVTPHFGQLTDLQELHLSHNPKLQSVASEIGSLMKLQALTLRGCPSLKTPPKEIVSRGFQAVFGYLHRLQMGSVECWRTKLMMVGLGGAGKTSLVRRLIEGSGTGFGSDMGEIITDGIEIKNWSLPIQDGDKNLDFSVWDFAGQTVYYNTHQFFLSNRAVYMLLWNMRLGYEHAGLDFWLSSIACHAPKAPILVIGSHRDQVSKFWLPEEEMRRRYPQIRGFHAISCYNGEGLMELQERLKEVSMEEKYMGEKIPEAWLNFEKKMLRFKKTKKQRLSRMWSDSDNSDSDGSDYDYGRYVQQQQGGDLETSNLLNWDKIEQLATECGIYEKMEILQSVQFLHELGSVQHFSNDFLKSKVVINPQWIVDAMACVVSVQNTPVVEGRLFHKDTKKIWKDYEKELLPWLLRLTEEFDLTFPLPEEKANLVPCLLPANEPEYSWPDVSELVDQRENKMLYKFDYLPAGLFNRAQVRLYQFSDSSVIWKKGSLLKKNGHLALLLHQKDSQVLCRVQGSRPENILFLVHEVFEGLIAESFHGVTYDYFVPCSDCLKVGTYDPCMFPASKIRRATELKAPFLQCDKYFHTLSLNELHSIMPPDNSADFDVHLERSLRDLRNLRDNLTYDVFMVYSVADIPQIGEEDRKVQPRRISEDLKAAGFKVWFTSDPALIRADQVTLTLRDARLVLVCISNGFVADQQCCEIFHYIRNMQKDLQLVVLGNGQEWQKSELGLQLASEVFVNMMNINRYTEKLKELDATISSKLAGVAVQPSEQPSCFISYCWANSQEAVSRGSRSHQGALGWGDPRGFKKFLEKNGISCWMDIERVGQGGLFEVIAKGLKTAKVMVACVSDEYAKSRNCQMEFRFASVVLRIPIVLAIVGTGGAWEASEVGMLALGEPKINFQYETPSAHQRLLEAVKKQLPDQTAEAEIAAERERNSASPSFDNNQLAYQELLELAQRKFLRQVAGYADAMNVGPYPRLFIIDLYTEDEKKVIEERQWQKERRLMEEKLKAEKDRQESCKAQLEQQGEEGNEENTCPNKAEAEEQEKCSETKADDAETTPRPGSSSSVRPSSESSSALPSLRPKSGKSRRGLLVKKSSSMQTTAALSEAVREIEDGKEGDSDVANSEYCIRVLCEHEGDWHVVEDCYIPLPPASPAQFQEFLNEVAPYLARLLAILRHAPLNLPILTTKKGEMLQKLIEDACGTESEYKQHYETIRSMTVSFDPDSLAGQLARCHLPSGKVMWLCPDHQKMDRVTVLSEEVADLAQTEQADQDDLMAEQINQSKSKAPITSLSDAKPADSQSEGRKTADGVEQTTNAKPDPSQRETLGKLTSRIKSRGKMIGAQTAARVAGGYSVKSQACNVM